jgi:hypothetical protein
MLQLMHSPTAIYCVDIPVCRLRGFNSALEHKRETGVGLETAAEVDNGQEAGRGWGEEEEEGNQCKSLEIK